MCLPGPHHTVMTRRMKPAGRRSAGTVARHAMLPLKVAGTRPTICSRMVERMPSAPINASPLALLPSARSRVMVAPS